MIYLLKYRRHFGVSFQDNQHRVTLVMSPSDDFEAKRQLQEEELLREYDEER